MVRMIDFIEEFCDFRGYSCERLDGRVSGRAIDYSDVFHIMIMLLRFMLMLHLTNHVDAAIVYAYIVTSHTVVAF